MNELPSLTGTQATTQCLSGFGGINVSGGAGAGELTDSANITTKDYPFLRPCDSQTEYYTAQQSITNLECFDGLIVIDGEFVKYNGETVGKVTAGKKQMAVVNTKLVIFPDKIMIDLTNGDVTQMDVSVTGLEGKAVFTEGDDDTGPSLSLALESVIDSQTKVTSAGEYKCWWNPTRGDIHSYTLGHDLKPGSMDDPWDELTHPGFIYVYDDLKYDFENMKWTCSGKKLVNLWGYLYSTWYDVATAEYCEEHSIESSDKVPFVDTGYTDPSSSVYGTPKNINKYVNVIREESEQGIVTYTLPVIPYSKGLITVTEAGKEAGYDANKLMVMNYINVDSDPVKQGLIVLPDDPNPLDDDMETPIFGLWSTGCLYPKKTEQDLKASYINVAAQMVWDVRLCNNQPYRLADIFMKDDTVTITGCTDLKENNQSKVSIRSVDAETNTITFALGTSMTAGTDSGTVTLKRDVPDLDYICENQNRLWGVSNGTGNVIYNSETGTFEQASGRVIWASALGDPLHFYDYEGLDTDSYAVAVGTDEDFTGIARYGQQTWCFKEDCIHRVVGLYPSQYYVYQSDMDGVAAGCSESILTCDGGLYYITRTGIMLYDGDSTNLVSYPLGEKRWQNAIGGTDGRRVYYCLQDSNGKWALYSYDPLHSIWMKLEESEIVSIASYNKKLYLAHSDGVYYYDPSADIGDWSFTMHPFDEGSLYRKRYSELNIRAEMAKGSHWKLEISQDGGRWQQVYRTRDYSLLNHRIPLPPTRCDNMAVRVSGTGKVVFKMMNRSYRMRGEEDQ